ncbi:MAG: hypothetical protein PHR77_09545 [Kiritimatiellae bacterium]|nr:hypothetical protein [Kiritimatiellia bacterium]MDD5520210.1 hypothetical protein [Kiritimatiellia bacterium]
MNIDKHRFGSLLTLLFFITCAICTGSSVTDGTSQLARELASEGKHESAAIEYRRLALLEEQQNRRAGYYWASAYEYLKATKYDLVQKMLDRAEDNSSDIITESLLIRAEASIGADKLTEAEFYLKSIIEDMEQTKKSPSKIKTIAAKKMAGVLIAKGNTGEARKALSQSPVPCPESIRAVASYEKGRNRNPKVGGILGLIPGLGYIYSGEYANAIRSFILNGIFIYAMADTADREEWGAFTALTFFELTWYTGSIYGGIDAAHRFNKNRLNSCIEAINCKSAFAPDLSQLPVISLKFEF